uniref:SH3 domain-containing protein n=1 Tax=Ascaris lumbricoides TaxID=6252 RepID=A0A0M3ISC8_ASCLU
MGIRFKIGVARAVYDNEAEWPDELAFERGEILRVLDERPFSFCIKINRRR